MNKIFFNHYLVLFIAITLVACTFSGCLDSPLLNHAKGSTSNLTIESADPLCPLFFSTQGLCASLEWIKQPTDEESGEFQLRFWNKEQSTINGPYVDPLQSVAAKLWMPSMGHGSSPVTVKKSVDSSQTPIPGIYNATNVFFVMGGKWEIWIQLKLPKPNDTIIDQAKFDVEI